MHDFKTGDKVRIIDDGTSNKRFVGAEAVVIESLPGRSRYPRIEITTGSLAGQRWEWSSNYLEPLSNLKAELEEALQAYAVADARGESTAHTLMLRALEVAVAALGTEIPEATLMEEPTDLGAAVRSTDGSQVYVRTVLMDHKGAKAWRLAAGHDNCPLLRWSELEAKGFLAPYSQVSG